MKIFISHSTNDVKLAKILKKILESDTSIESVFIFEEEKKYGIQIDKKIIDEINKSDHIIAIITKDAKASASVNQEIGYAQAKSITIIPMIEENSKEGFLVYGVEKILFTRDKFEHACREARDHVIKLGPRKRDESTFTVQEMMIQKSAQFRFWLEYELQQILDSFVIRLEIDSEYYRKTLFSANMTEQKHGLNKLKNFTKDVDNLVKHLMHVPLDSFRGFAGEYALFTSRLHDTEEAYPKSEILPTESHLLIQLKHRIMESDYWKFDPEKLTKDLVGDSSFPTHNYKNFEELSKDFNDNTSVLLIRNFNSLVRELSVFIRTIVTLEEEMVRIHETYGDLGFKSTFSDDLES